MVDAKNVKTKDRMTMARQTKQETYFKTCEAWDGRVACTRRHCVAVLVRNDVVISIGYNGSVRGSLNCGEDCPCIKDLYNEERLTSYQLCPATTRRYKIHSHSQVPDEGSFMLGKDLGGMCVRIAPPLKGNTWLPKRRTHGWSAVQGVRTDSKEKPSLPAVYQLSSLSQIISIMLPQPF